MPPTALVTGASGFVGRRLADTLSARGWLVHALMRRPCPGPWQRQITLDLARDEVPAGLLTDVDTIFHAAGKAHAVERLERSADYHAVNVRGTAALLAAARTAAVPRFVYISSVKAVGDPPRDSARGPADELYDPPADSPYGQSKRAAERLVLAAATQTSGEGGAALHACVLRPTLVYGRGVKGNLERMLAAIDRGLFPPLPDVKNRRTMVHVDDLVQATLLAAEHPAANGRTYIVTDGQVYSTRDVYLAMCTALGRPVPPWSVPAAVLEAGARVGDLLGWLGGRRFPLDSTALSRLMESAWYTSARIQGELGFRPRYTLETALPGMVGTYRQASGAGAGAATDTTSRRSTTAETTSSASSSGAT